jgi:hypothetical protein
MTSLAGSVLGCPYLLFNYITLFFSLLIISAPILTYNIQFIVTLASVISVFSLSVSTIILELNILANDFRKYSNFIQLQILKLTNRNYRTD